MEAWLNFIGMIIVAIISLAGIVIQTKSKEKQDSMEKKIDEFREESANSDKELDKKLDDIRMNGLKRFLVNELTKIKQKEYTPNEEQKRMLKDSKDEYNAAGGDSYVDDLYDDVKKSKLI